MRQHFAISALFISLMGALIFGDSVDPELEPFVVQIECVYEYHWDSGDVTYRWGALGMGVMVSPNAVLTGAQNLLEYFNYQDAQTPLNCDTSQSGFEFQKTGLGVVRNLGTADEELIWVDHWIIHEGYRYSAGTTSPPGMDNNVALLILSNGENSAEPEYPLIADSDLDEEYAQPGVDAATVLAMADGWGWWELSQVTRQITETRNCHRSNSRFASTRPLNRDGFLCWGSDFYIYGWNYGTPLLVRTEGSWMVAGVIVGAGVRLASFYRVAPLHDWIRAKIDGLDIPAASSDPVQVGDLVIMNSAHYSEIEDENEEFGFVAKVLEDGMIDVAVVQRGLLNMGRVAFRRPLERGDRVSVVWADVTVEYYGNVLYDPTGVKDLTWRKMSDR
ncbi:MAG: hypothetical protein OXH11_04490 [Candidatus Aminicenantes bacterium]|nr:hypothetical protein [Candidatus Aminicenantes bacterium]